MEAKASAVFLRMSFLVAILSALLTAGCATTQETASPPVEERKEPAAVVKPEPIPPPQPAKKPVELPAPMPPRASSPAPVPTPVQPPPAPEARPHPVASGEVLLDPAVSRDAHVIQVRLAELGFYKGAIDGKWGRGSRAALKSFKEKNALAEPESWDKETQILLFRETGR